MTKLSKEKLLVALEEMMVSHNIFMIAGKYRKEVEDIFEAAPQKQREQAYQQIRDLITWYFPVVIEQKKPRVTEEWIEEKAVDLMDIVDNPHMVLGRKILKVQDFIRSLVEECTCLVDISKG